NQNTKTSFSLTFIEDSLINIEIEALDTSFIVGFDEWVHNHLFKFRVIKTNADNHKIKNYDQYIVYFNSLDRLVSQYRSKLQINPLSEKGTILELSTSGFVPEKEMDYLNKLTETYIQQGLEEKNKIAINTIEFIDEQISNITDSLFKTEMTLQNFRLENDVIDISREGQALYLNYEKLQTELAEETVKFKYLEYLKKSLNAERSETSIIAPTIAGINDQVLTSMITQVNRLISEKQTLEFTTRKEVGKTKLLEQQIQKLQEGLAMSVNSMLDQAQMKIDDINTRTANVVVDLKKQPINERLLLGIKRKFTLNDNIYTYLLEKRAEAGIKRASNIPDARVLDAAGDGNVRFLSPKYKQNLILGVLLGALLPLLIIFIADFLNVKIYDRKEIEENTKIPILGSIGHNATDYDLIVSEKPRSSITESFRTIKTNLQFITGEEGCKVIMITSGVSGEGKTFCSINLASVYGSLNKKTVLLGLDLRKPKIHKMFGISNDLGIYNYLLGKASLSDITFKTEVANLDIIPAGTVSSNPNQLLESKVFKEFLNNLKTQYEIIIIDTPPVALVSDAVYISQFCDAVVFVVRMKYTTRQVYNIMNDLYENRGIKNLLIALNDVKHRGYYGYGSYGYGRYGYGYNYGGYYDDAPPPKPWIFRLFDKKRT
ncbi:MAG: polysaccharide biosynthesis tyrosine autokinase, partial [Salinivirgaceae bacterium]|nr:polysaccharide biosynthesis tyrosine autokinase [Salinivirgaceae bacterium]